MRRRCCLSVRRSGCNAGPQVDIAVDPLEGTTLCAKNMPGAIATMAMADGGTLLHAPDVYMQKLAVGPGYAKGVVELDATPADNVRRLAKAKGRRCLGHHGAGARSPAPCRDHCRRSAAPVLRYV